MWHLKKYDIKILLQTEIYFGITTILTDKCVLIVKIVMVKLFWKKGHSS